MVDAMDQALVRYWPAYNATWQGLDLLKASHNGYLRQCNPTEWQSNVLTKAVTLNLYSYIETKLLMDATVVIKKPGLSLLEIALSLGHQKKNFSLEMVELLLRYGADPNKISGKFTTWQRSLDWVHTQDWDNARPVSASPYFELTRWANTFKLLLQHGANPYETCRYEHKSKANQKLESHKVSDVITDVFGTRLPHEAGELRYILQKQMEIHDKTEQRRAIFSYSGDRDSKKRKRSVGEEQEPCK